VEGRLKALQGRIQGGFLGSTFFFLKKTPLPKNMLEAM